MYIYSKSVHTNACNKQSDVCYLSYFHVHTAINILRCFGYPREHNFGLVLILSPTGCVYFPQSCRNTHLPHFLDCLLNTTLIPCLLVCFLSILHERVCDYSGVQSSVTGILRMGDMNIHITWLTHVRTGPKKKKSRPALATRDYRKSWRQTVLRDPFQVTCCGNIFCQLCIKRVQADKKSCPTCNEADFGVFPDKRLRRSLYAFQVRCVHQKSGCEWIGELGELDGHLNLNLELGRQLVGCEFASVASTSSVAMCMLTKTNLAPSVLSAVTTARTIVLGTKT